MFAFGKFGAAGINQVLSMPDPEKFCVVASGAGYLVSAFHPEVWEPVRLTLLLERAAAVIDRSEMEAVNRLCELSS